MPGLTAGTGRYTYQETALLLFRKELLQEMPTKAKSMFHCSCRPDLEFQSNWIKTHAQVSTNVLEKPLILEEFGKKLPHDAQDSESDIGQTRDPLYARTLELVANEIVNHKSVGGALFWRLHLSTYEGRGRGEKLQLMQLVKFFKMQNLCVCCQRYYFQ